LISRNILRVSTANLLNDNDPLFLEPGTVKTFQSGEGTGQEFEKDGMTEIKTAISFNPIAKTAGTVECA